MMEFAPEKNVLFPALVAVWRSSPLSPRELLPQLRDLENTRGGFWRRLLSNGVTTDGQIGLSAGPVACGFCMGMGMGTGMGTGMSLGMGGAAGAQRHG